MKLAGSETGNVAAEKCQLARDVLRTFGTLRFAATGWSMLPTIWSGEMLVVERLGLSQIRVGDVVLVGRNDRLCAHRVVGKAGDSANPRWMMRGDALSAPDRPVSANEILGRVTHMIREGKLVPVPTELSVIEQLLARVIRRSFPAARAFIFLHSKFQSPRVRERQSVVPCQS
jgi:hypothetical protein